MAHNASSFARGFRLDALGCVQSSGRRKFSTHLEQKQTIRWSPKRVMEEEIVVGDIKSSVHQHPFAQFVCVVGLKGQREKRRDGMKPSSPRNNRNVARSVHSQV